LKKNTLQQKVKQVSVTEKIIQHINGYERKIKRFRDFLSRVSNEFPHVVYIAGNHEFYHGKWKASLDHLCEACSLYPNIYFL
jgi:hypothetical protein